MTVRCTQCANFSLKVGRPDDRAVGLYTCAKGPAWEFPNPFFERECGKFAPALESEAEARRKFEGAEAVKAWGARLKQGKEAR